jgi:hypothetical protein
VRYNQRAPMLKISGAILFAVGIAAGIMLVVAPFGFVGSHESPASAWLLFPGGFTAGSLLLALSSRPASLGWLWRVCSTLLLALASAAAIGLVLPVLGVVEPAGNTLPLWYVLALSGGVGAACALVPMPPAAA